MWAIGKGSGIKSVKFRFRISAAENHFRIMIVLRFAGYVPSLEKNIILIKGEIARTGEMVDVVPKKLPFFKCGKELKERVDYS